MVIEEHRYYKSLENDISGKEEELSEIESHEYF